MRRALITILMVLFITSLSSLSISQTPQDQKTTVPSRDSNPDWVQVDVTVTDKGGTYLLTSKNRDGGAIETSKANVEIVGKIVKLRVRDNTDAKVIKTPVTNKVGGKGATPKSAGDCVNQEGCPTKCGGCFPTGVKDICVRLCCGTGGTRGIASGMWGCP